MSRTNHSPEYRAYKNRRPAVHRLGAVGLAVFRGVDYEALAPTIQAIQENVNGNAMRIRSHDAERPLAVSLLESSEVKRTRSLGSVAVKDAIDEIYENVHSLRHSLTATPSHIQFLGRGDVKHKSLTVIFDKDTTDQLDEERARILEALEEINGPLYDQLFGWYRHKRPHLSLARMKHESHIVDFFVKKSIEDSLPEAIQLKRASFFYPNGQVRPKNSF